MLAATMPTRVKKAGEAIRRIGDESCHRPIALGDGTNLNREQIATLRACLVADKKHFPDDVFQKEIVGFQVDLIKGEYFLRLLSDGGKGVYQTLSFLDIGDLLALDPFTREH